MPLSRQLARMLGGDITVQSELGQGSTFTLTLPLKYGSIPADAPAEPSAKKRVRRRRDDTFRYILRQWIGGAGLYAITEASNGEEALQLIAEEPPDVMVLDLTMPIVDGFAVLRTSRRKTALCCRPSSSLPPLSKTRAYFPMEASSILYRKAI